MIVLFSLGTPEQWGVLLTTLKDEHCPAKFKLFQVLIIFTNVSISENDKSLNAKKNELLLDLNVVQLR